MPNVAIVGTEGAGKTVFVTALAKLYSQLRDDGVYMTPMNRATASYIERAWQALCNYEWPPSTPPGELVHLHWQLHLGEDRPLCDLRLVDAPGQDLRLLFGEEQAADAEQLPVTMQMLVENLQTADVVLCLVNLRDFFGESIPERRVANQWVIRFAMDFLQQHRPCRFGLVFTQVDQYQAELARFGGWSQLAAHCLPYVYESYLRGGNVPIFPVAAVNATRVLTDDDGRPRRVPERGFKCSGYSKLMRWMADTLNEVSERLEGSGAPPSNSSGQTAQDGGWRAIASLTVEYCVLAVVIMLAIISVGWLSQVAGCGAPTKGSPASAQPPRPRVQWAPYIDRGWISTDIVVTNASPFEITNVRLHIRTVASDGEERFSAFPAATIPAASAYRFENVPRGINEEDIWLDCDQCP